MQVSVESPSKTQKRLTIIVPSSRVEKAYGDQLSRFAKKVEIKGFRAGKVPLDMVKQRFGQEVRGEALNALIQETLTEALKQEKLYPISTPQIETKPSADPSALEYTATFDVLPEIGDIHFKGGSLDKLTAQITEQDIEKTLASVREQNLTWKKVERPAQEKDKINGKIQMFAEEGKPLTPDSMPLEFVLKDEPSIFGWNLTEKLGGASAGETKAFSHTLPDESFLQGMGGKELSFKIEVLEVSEPVLPALDEFLVKKLGVKSGSLDDLKAEIRKQLELNLKRTVKSLLKEQVFDLLMEQNPMDIPRSLIEREAKYLHDENCSMQQQGQHNHSEEDEVYFTQVAQKRILLGMLVGEYANKNKLNPGAERIDEYLKEFASVYTDADEYIRRMKADKEKLREIETFILEDQVVEKLLENVSIVEKEVSYEKLITKGNHHSQGENTITQEGA